jgi:hypothetical protein
MFLAACSVWICLMQNPARAADETMYTYTISCQTMSDVFVLMHMWKFYTQPERVAALTYLVGTKGSCIIYAHAHHQLDTSTKVAEYYVWLKDRSYWVSVYTIPGPEATEYVISSRLER